MLRLSCLFYRKSKPSLPKRQCLSSQSSLDVYKEELDDSDCDITDNGYDVDDTVPCIPKDPYEFTEFDETAPSERGFRQKEFQMKVRFKVWFLVFCLLST